MRVAFLGSERREPSIFAALIRAGHQLVTWEGPWSVVSPEVALCATLSETLTGADAVISIGPDDQALHNLVMRRGLLDRLPSETVHVSLTRASVLAAQHLTDMHQAKEQRFVSAPLIDGADGSMSVVAAGPPDSMRRVKPLLDLLGPCNVVAEVPWHANLVDQEITRLAETGPERADEVYAAIRAAGIPLDLFQLVARSSLPSGVADQGPTQQADQDAAQQGDAEQRSARPSQSGIAGPRPARPLLRSSVDLANQA